MNGEDILKAVFEAPEENVETFMSVIKPQVTDPNASDVSKIVRGNPEQIAAPDFTENKSGWIRMLHGWHDQDYVWHISPWHEKKPWKVSKDRLLYAVAQTMNTVIPTTIEVRIWLPRSDWEVPEYTFKAMGLKEAWNVTDEHLQKLNLKLFEILNTLV